MLFHANNIDVPTIAPRKEGGGAGHHIEPTVFAHFKMPATSPFFHQYMPHKGIDMKGGYRRWCWAQVGRTLSVFFFLQRRDSSHTNTGSSEVAAGGELAGVGYGEALRLALRLSRSVARIWSSFPLRTRCSS